MNLVNPKATRTTAATMLIADHYEKLGMDQPLSKREVLSFCKLLKVTPYELGAMVQVDFSDMKKYLDRDRFPMPVSLHFRLIREWYMHRHYGGMPVPIVPIDHLVPPKM